METVNFGMEGKVALVTGAGRGIGLAMARAMAGVGCAVGIQDIDLEVAKREAGRICAEGGKAIALGGDLGDLSLAGRLVGEVVEKLGGLHVLVNNGAIQVHRHWMEVSLEEMRRQFDVDLMMPILLCQEAARVFKKQGWGRILSVGSVQQIKGNEVMLPYSLSKAALEKMTYALARDLGPSGVTVNLIAPGWFDTQRNEEYFRTHETKGSAGSRLPARRIGEPRDVAGVTLLLCSEAGSYITGQSIGVDGGMSA